MNLESGSLLKAVGERSLKEMHEEGAFGRNSCHFQPIFLLVLQIPICFAALVPFFSSGTASSLIEM